MRDCVPGECRVGRGIQDEVRQLSTPGITTNKVMELQRSHFSCSTTGPSVSASQREKSRLEFIVKCGRGALCYGNADAGKSK